MEEEEDDRALLTSLGVTSANPEDIERDVLEQAKSNVADGSEAGGSTEEELLERTKSHITSSTSHGNLYSKLRALKVEIEAVKSSFEIGRSSRYEGHKLEAREELENVVDEDANYRGSLNDLSLQQALAADRLKSLKKRKAQLEREISGTAKDGQTEKAIRHATSEAINFKQRQKGFQKRSKDPEKRSKTVSFSEDDDFDVVLNAASAGFVETERDELVRKGVLTPFHKLKGFERRIQDSGAISRENELENVDKNDDFASSSIDRVVRSISEAAQARPTTILLDPEVLPKLDAPTHPFQRLKAPLRTSCSVDVGSPGNKGPKRKRKRAFPAEKRRKVSSYKQKTTGAESSCHDEDQVEDATGLEDEDSEEISSVMLEGGLRIPEVIFNQLFDYQKVGVQWLWELHCQRAGGIIGDEMGLGKTIQIIAFLGSLHFSNMYKPSIIVCPVTLLLQWKREVQKWYPGFHVEVLHDSALYASNRKTRVRQSSSDDEGEDTSDSDSENTWSSKKTQKWESMLKRVLGTESGLLITTYEQLRLQGNTLLDVDWGYAVLDEGHRIRNPNAEITLVCKQLQTVHRIIMTGAPIQNKLNELWSLFDFVFPGKLGVLPVFEAEFAVPISVGGYANATPLQVSTAYRCAVVLRDLIMPYLLRRMKVDVNAQLPKKAEHVLFCSLTADQRSVYRAFLASSDVEQIFDGNKNSLYGIDIMRKICNHPDLLEREHSYKDPDYGNPERSGKMKVVAQVLKVWKEQGHRVLLFAQTQQMLDILENFLVAGDYSYRRMDGSTPIKHRMNLIDEFNNSEDIFIFILTTKVGGLGTNLTGANRVIIFDPDWNPSTDMQARERAWRIGQKKDVTVYRLITKGTIEEKVYHRQIYKHFLTNKILKNPQQRRFFKARDMKDLFTLNDDVENSSTETSNIFGQLSEDVNVIGAQHENQNKAHSHVPVAAATVDAVNDQNDSHGGCEEDSTLQSNRKVDEETNILQSLFDAHGIHSAMNHDAIMNAHSEENAKIEDQASRVAHRAAEALRQSRIIRSRDHVAVPTWTGKSGAAGAPSSVRRKFGSTVNTQLVSNSRAAEDLTKGEYKHPNGVVAGASSGRALSSAVLLARIRGNKESAVSQGLEQQFGLASSSNGRERSVTNVNSNSSRAQPEVLIRQLCTFIQQKGGRANSAGIVNHFKEKIPSKDLPLFKNLLKEIATLEKNSGGNFWVLKPEHQQQ